MYLEEDLDNGLARTALRTVRGGRPDEATAQPREPVGFGSPSVAGWCAGASRSEVEPLGDDVLGDVGDASVVASGVGADAGEGFVGALAVGAGQVSLGLLDDHAA